MPEKLPGWKHFYSGKIRDLYESEDPSQSDLVLIVATDRISAFDNILSPAIPGKGENLTAITNFWFEKLDVPNHRVHHVAAPAEVAHRATVAKKLEMYPVECVVRGYIAGSGYKEYLATGEICGIKLPLGLKDGDKLPEPIFTPAFKAELGEHDQNIDFAKVVVLTPDSSRYWDKQAYEQGKTVESFDKQIVRNWLLQIWDPEGSNPPTVLSPELVEKVSSRYAELRKKLTDANQ